MDLLKIAAMIIVMPLLGAAIIAALLLVFGLGALMLQGLATLSVWIFGGSMTQWGGFWMASALLGYGVIMLYNI